MGKHCFVPNCKSGYESMKGNGKISLFKAPTDSTMLEKWNRAILREDKNITSKDHVCELHFQDHEVTKEWKAERNGEIIMLGARRAKLLLGSIPSRFPECPNNLSKIIKPKGNGLRKRKPRDIKTYGANHSKLPCLQADQESGEFINIVELDPSSIYTNKPNFEFADLCRDLYVVQLPSEYWSVHKCITEHSKFVSFQESFFTKAHHCVIRKQIVIMEDLSIKVFILQKDCTPCITKGQPESIYEISSILSTIHSKNICSGQPTPASFQGVKSESAFIDILGLWRHNKCGILSDTEQICPECASLENTFQTYQRRRRKEIQIKVETD